MKIRVTRISNIIGIGFLGFYLQLNLRPGMNGTSRYFVKFKKALGKTYFQF